MKEIEIWIAKEAIEDIQEGKVITNANLFTVQPDKTSYECYNPVKVSIKYA